jgi:hypothetical protein
MSKALTLRDIEAAEDPLSTFNDGIGAGMAIGMKSPWVKFLRNDQRTWPPHAGKYVTLQKNERGRTLYFDYAGDMDCEWTLPYNGYTAKNPAYWCPMPDPKDFT